MPLHSKLCWRRNKPSLSTKLLPVILVFLQGSAVALTVLDGLVINLLVANFLWGISAKTYENRFRVNKVTVIRKRLQFFWDTVYTGCHWLVLRRTDIRWMNLTVGFVCDCRMCVRCEGSWTVGATGRGSHGGFRQLVHGRSISSGDRRYAVRGAGQSRRQVQCHLTPRPDVSRSSTTKDVRSSTSTNWSFVTLSACPSLSITKAFSWL